MKNKYRLCVSVCNYITVEASDKGEVERMADKIFSEQKLTFKPEDVKILDAIVVPE